jgi:hypothetical protein
LTTAAADGGLDLMLSASDALVVVALAALAIMAALCIKDDDFTLDPTFPELFVATFRSQELQDRDSKVIVSQERSSVSSG